MSERRYSDENGQERYGGEIIQDLQERINNDQVPRSKVQGFKMLGESILEAYDVHVRQPALRDDRKNIKRNPG